MPTMRFRGSARYRYCRSSKKITYEENQIDGGIDPCDWLVMIILNSSGAEASSVINFPCGSGANGSAKARCRNIGKIFSLAGASGVEMPAVRNSNAAPVSEKCH